MQFSAIFEWSKALDTRSATVTAHLVLSPTETGTENIKSLRSEMSLWLCPTRPVPNQCVVEENGDGLEAEPHYETLSLLSSV